MNAGRRAALAALATMPLAVRAQVRVVRRRIAFVGFSGMLEDPNGLAPVIEALARRGYVHGRQIEIIRIVVPERPADHPASGLEYLVPTLRAHVLPAKPEVIVVIGSLMTRAMHDATKTIPIVTSASDPVDLGVAASLARPGGNVTGIAGGVAETSLKAMEAAKAILPRLARIAILHYDRPVATQLAGHYASAARALGIEPLLLRFAEEGEELRLLRELRGKRVQAAVLAWPGPEGLAFFREALAQRVPLVGTSEEDVVEGCLVAYVSLAGNLPERMAAVLEEIIGGADPATTPFQFPQAFRLVINRRVARALGLAVPPALLLRADRVIE